MLETIFGTIQIEIQVTELRIQTLLHSFRVYTGSETLDIYPILEENDVSNHQDSTCLYSISFDQLRLNLKFILHKYRIRNLCK